MTLTRYTAITAGFGGLSWLAAASFLDPPARRAVGFSAALATLNALAAFAITTWAVARPLKLFLSAVLGGMLVRLVVLLGALAAAIAWLGLRTFPLVAALFVYYTLFLAFELAVLYRPTSIGTALQ